MAQNHQTPQGDSLIRRFREGRVLAGFMDEVHFNSFAQIHVPHFEAHERADLESRVAAARLACARLGPADTSDVVIRPLIHPRVEELEALPAFQNAFGSTSYQFAWIDPSRVVPLQVWTASNTYSLGEDEDERVELCMPLPTVPPVEVTGSRAGEFHVISVLSSAPHGTRFNLTIDPNGSVIAGPATHLNLLQVVHIGSIYLAVNGTHRLFEAVTSQVSELPALVRESPSGNALTGLPELGYEGFSVPFVFGARRPPLISDLNSSASITMTLRERRYGYQVLAAPLLLPI